MRILAFRLVVGMTLLCGIAAAAAQTENRVTVSGTIKDASGAVVSGAQIVVKLEKCKCKDCKPPEECKCCPNQIRAASGEDGTFEFSVPHGTYTAEVTAGKFKVTVNLDLNEGNTKNVNVTVQ